MIILGDYTQLFWVMFVAGVGFEVGKNIMRFFLRSWRIAVIKRWWAKELKREDQA